jgi:hypothetical protein
LGVEAEGLPDAAQGNMEGAGIKGGIEQAVQAGIQEFQLFQEGGLPGLLLLALLPVKVAGEMLGMAAEGRGAEAELPAQGAVGDPVDEAAVDLRAGGVSTDGTTWHHEWSPRQKFPPDAGWVSGYQERGGRTSTGGTVGRGRVKVRKQSLGENLRSQVQLGNEKIEDTPTKGKFLYSEDINTYSRDRISFLGGKLSSMHLCLRETLSNDVRSELRWTKCSS